MIDVTTVFELTTALQAVALVIIVACIIRAVWFVIEAVLR